MSNENTNGSIGQDELARILDGHRSRSEKIVMTNGVFDLIHPGHIEYLRQAKSYGDLLVVALNTDASVHRLKGPLRPILPEWERAKIIASLDMVDYVTLFEEDTPIDVIRKFRPNVLVKGGDYVPDTVVGRDFVESTGGCVKIVKFVGNFSSTNIIDRIIDSGKVQNGRR